jgi:hypothetical protein
MVWLSYGEGLAAHQIRASHEHAALPHCNPVQSTLRIQCRLNRASLWSHHSRLCNAKLGDLLGTRYSMSTS